MDLPTGTSLQVLAEAFLPSDARPHPVHDPSLGHGRRLDFGRLAVLAVAPLRDRTLGAALRLGSHRGVDGGVVLIRHAASVALADRQHQLPPPSTISTRACRATGSPRRTGLCRRCGRSSPQPVGRAARAVAHPEGRGGGWPASARPRGRPRKPLSSRKASRALSSIAESRRRRSLRRWRRRRPWLPGWPPSPGPHPIDVGQTARFRSRARRQSVLSRSWVLVQGIPAQK
ncbi:MAG: hypothetical protein OJF58_001140 [Enhydrobacter sp.]|nr:MAG: hypothetical protein OJF58_001140 [Enhydrobacter sp.]